MLRATRVMSRAARDDQCVMRLGRVGTMLVALPRKRIVPYRAEAVGHLSVADLEIGPRSDTAASTASNTASS